MFFLQRREGKRGSYGRIAIRLSSEWEQKDLIHHRDIEITEVGVFLKNNLLLGVLRTSVVKDPNPI